MFSILPHSGTLVIHGAIASLLTLVHHKPPRTLPPCPTQPLPVLMSMPILPLIPIAVNTLPMEVTISLRETVVLLQANGMIL